MTKENIYYMDDNAFDRFYKRARYQANSFVAGKLGSKAADYLTTLPDFAYLICKLMLDPDVPSSRKLDLGFALLYVLSPLDLVPDSFPLLGKIDDAYAILVGGQTPAQHRPQYHPAPLARRSRDDRHRARLAQLL